MRIDPPSAPRIAPSREPRLALLALLSSLALAGCIQHEVRVDPPTGGAPPQAQLLVGFRAAAPGSAVVRTSPMPIDLAITAWSVTQDGIVRADFHARSPTPWWQRFPCDIVADLLPKRFIARTQVTLAYRTITPQDRATTPEDLASEALAHGYAQPPHREP